MKGSQCLSGRVRVIVTKLLHELNIIIRTMTSKKIVLNIHKYDTLSVIQVLCNAFMEILHPPILS